ncbi:MAG: hypothetical protein KatS3mg027_1672 [Bacteroidia bacterium]|nr:MAG: hypothetical protein KatS3mg027_1672 [Bacteroidia bacterium]
MKITSHPIFKIINFFFSFIGTCPSNFFGRACPPIRFAHRGSGCFGLRFAAAIPSAHSSAPSLRPFHIAIKIKKGVEGEAISREKARHCEEASLPKQSPVKKPVIARSIATKQSQLFSHFPFRDCFPFHFNGRVAMTHVISRDCFATTSSWLAMTSTLFRPFASGQCRLRASLLLEKGSPRRPPHPSRNDFKPLYSTIPIYLSILLLLTTTIIQSCKVKMSLSGATIPPEAKTVSVEYFGNQSSIAGPHVPQRFTEKLRDVLQSQTNLSLVPKNGDLQFSGYIADYVISPVAIQSSDRPAQNRLTISVFVKYTNPFDPSKSFEQTFTRYTDYDGTKNISEVENNLLNEIFRQLTEDIFNRAFNNW